MARNKYPEQTVEMILDVAERLFLEKGYEKTTIKDIVDNMNGMTKGAIYHHFKGKEEILTAVESRIALRENPFETVKDDKSLSGLEKLRKVINNNQARQSDKDNRKISSEMLPLLENPQLLANIIESNRTYLSPKFYELLEEGRKDGSIKTEYTKEISELIPLLEIWLMPSVYPATSDEIKHKLEFIMEIFNKLGVPLFDDKFIHDAIATLE
ncbi:MAG: TetR/AcrR family transcriptional regulator [Catonella sp.]|nr:TetR/AcrR family transcriptional regulator [Catonella sp.]